MTSETNPVSDMPKQKGDELVNVRHLLAVLIAGAAASFSPARAEVTNCQEITSLPAQIITQGVHCLKRDLSTSAGTGTAIEILANNVTIDLNGFKLGGLAAGTATQTVGIHANGRQNITIRNGTIRGFHTALHFEGSAGGSSNSSGHVVENLRIENSRRIGINVMGNYIAVRDNVILKTGSNTFDGTAIYVALSEGVVVSGNMVKGVFASPEHPAIGISAASVKGLVIRDNDVLNIGPALAGWKRAINVWAYGAIVDGNRIVNGSAGDHGIIVVNDSEDIACVGNTAMNFATPYQGCAELQGNVP